MESLYTRLDALKREMLGGEMLDEEDEDAAGGLGYEEDEDGDEDRDGVRGKADDATTGAGRRDGPPARTSSIGVEEVTSRVTAENAAEVLRRCDELEAALIADADEAPARRAQRRRRQAARVLNDAFESFVYARGAQEGRRGAPAANAARRREAYDTMFPRPASARAPGPTAGTDAFCCRAQNAASSALYCSCPECRGARRRPGGDGRAGGPPRGRQQHEERRRRAGAPPSPCRRAAQQRRHTYDDVRTASHAAASAVKAAAETVRQGPGARGAELAWRKERVALMREMGALRRHAASCEQQLRVLRQRTESREDEMRHVKAVVRQRDELILEAEGRLQELQRLHAEELRAERKRASHAESTRDNLALVYRSSLLRLLNDRCDACRATMRADDEIKSVFLDGMYDVERAGGV